MGSLFTLAVAASSKQVNARLPLVYELAAERLEEQA